MEVFTSLTRTPILGKVSDLPKGTQMGVQTSERVSALPGGSERGPMQSLKFTARKGTLRNLGCSTFKTPLLQSSHTRSRSSFRWGPVSSGSQEHLRRESADSTTPFCLPLQKQAVLCPRRAAGPPASGPHLEPFHPGGRCGPTLLQMVGSLASGARLRLPLSWENE